MKRIGLTLLLCAMVLLSAALPAMAAEAETEEGAVETVTERVVVPTGVCAEPELPENTGDLFLGWLEGGEKAALQSSAGSGMTGLNAELYAWLKTEIEAVANGENRSAIFTIRTAEFEDCNFTRENLYHEGDPSQPLSDEECHAVYESIMGDLGYDPDAVLQALMVDCPYSLYWYNKDMASSGGVSHSEPYSISSRTTSYSSGLTVVNTTISVTQIEFSFIVANAYQDAEAGENSLYTVRGDLDDTISAVRDAAAQIVADNAGKSDYEKLLAYKEAICNLVSYNHEAAEHPESVGYGNPWQLIYVFDGDETTNVVCEGYAKAFQYLCDLSSFNNAECYTIHGYMSSGDGSGGAHMWNHVKLDGTYYMADVTNCDGEASIGYPDRLFLKGMDADTATTPAEGWYYSKNTSYTSYAYYGYLENPYTGQDEVLYLSAEDYTPSMLKTLEASDFLLTVESCAYDGTAHPAVVSYQGEATEETAGALTVTYAAEGADPVEDAPVDAGTYTVYVSAAGGTAYAPGTVELGSFAINPVYAIITIIDEPGAVEAGSSFTVTVTLTYLAESGEIPIPGAVLSTTVNGLTITSASAETDETGTAVFTLTAGEPKPDASLFLDYAGSVNYVPTSQNILINVTNFPEPFAYMDEDGVMTVKVSDPALYGQTVYAALYTNEGQLLLFSSGTLDGSGECILSFKDRPELADAWHTSAFIVENGTGIPLTGAMRTSKFVK